MEYPNPDILVTPKWLYENIDNPNLVIVDCPWEYYSYTRAHIPGAVCRPGHSYIKSLDGNNEQTVLVATESEVRELLSDLGIGADSTVVAYDEWGSIFAARLWWVLKLYGFDRVKILDGGWQNWVSSNMPINVVTTKPAAITNPVELNVNPEVQITIDELLSSYEDQDLQIVDARSFEEYKGLGDQDNKRAGHIPGAIHLEWNMFLENSADPEGIRKFKSSEEIKSLLDKVGIDESKETVTHCQAAVRGAFAAFVLELMGFKPPRLYDGSMAEWANRDDTPLE